MLFTVFALTFVVTTYQLQMAEVMTMKVNAKIIKNILIEDNLFYNEDQQLIYGTGILSF